MADRIDLIVRLGAAINACADPVTQAVLRDALAAIVEDAAPARAESQRRSRRSSYVYYARSGDQVKIGVSRNPWARLRELQVGRPDLVLVGIEAGDSTLERERHVQFKADRIAGEWFRWSTALAAFVATVALRSNDDSDVAATLATASPPPAGKEKGFICPPPTASPSDGATPRPPRAKRPSAPWMGLMAKAWTLGTLPPGSATLLQPVVAEVGPEETASRLARYCQQADAEYASVRQFVSKHARYAEQVATQPAPSAPRQLRATEMLL